MGITKAEAVLLAILFIVISAFAHIAMENEKLMDEIAAMEKAEQNEK